MGQDCIEKFTESYQLSNVNLIELMAGPKRNIGNEIKKF